MELKSKNQEKLDFSNLRVQEMYDNSTNRNNLLFSIKYNHNKTLTKRINQYSLREMDVQMQVVAEVYNRLILHPISEEDRKLNFYLLLMEDIWNKLPQYVDKYNHLQFKYSHDYHFNGESNQIFLTIEQRNVIVG